jgi:hypothetical protein
LNWSKNNLDITVNLPVAPILIICKLINKDVTRKFLARSGQLTMVYSIDLFTDLFKDNEIATGNLNYLTWDMGLIV